MIMYSHDHTFFAYFLSLRKSTNLNYHDIGLWQENKSSNVEEVRYCHLSLIFLKFYDIYFEEMPPQAK